MVKSLKGLIMRFCNIIYKLDLFKRRALTSRASPLTLFLSLPFRSSRVPCLKRGFTVIEQDGVVDVPVAVNDENKRAYSGACPKRA